MFLLRTVIFGGVSGFAATGLFNGIITHGAMIASGGTYLTTSVDKVLTYGFESGFWIAAIGGLIGFWISLYCETREEMIRDSISEIKMEIGRLQR